MTNVQPVSCEGDMVEPASDNNTVVYQVTRERCVAGIIGVCPGCGGEVTAIETVNNAGEPTFWSGCEHCSVFTGGCPVEVHHLARTLVEEGTLVPYKDQDAWHWLESNTRRVAQILTRIDRLRRSGGEVPVLGANTEVVVADDVNQSLRVTHWSRCPCNCGSITIHLIPAPKRANGHVS